MFLALDSLRRMKKALFDWAAQQGEPSHFIYYDAFNTIQIMFMVKIDMSFSYKM